MTEYKKVEVAKALPVGTNVIGATISLGTDGTYYVVPATDTNGHLQVDVLSGGGAAAGDNYTKGLPIAGVAHGSKAIASVNNNWGTIGTVPTGNFWYIYALRVEYAATATERSANFSLDESTTYFAMFRASNPTASVINFPMYIKATAAQKVSVTADTASFMCSIFYFEVSA